MSCPYQKGDKLDSGFDFGITDQNKGQNKSQNKALEIRGAKFSEDICDYANGLLLSAMDGNDPTKIDRAARELKDCQDCKTILDMHLKIRDALCSKPKLKAPTNLKIQISENLKRMNLGELDITDFYPQP